MRYTSGTFIATFALLALSPFSAAGAQFDYDAAVQPGSFVYSESQLYAGEQVRVYVTIINSGNKDIRGVAQFYQGAIALGEPRPFSVKAQSVPAYIWTDWRPSEGTYNISVSIVGTEPDDQNLTNNMGVTPLMTIAKRPPPPPPPPPPVQTPVPAVSAPSSQGQSQNSNVPSSQTKRPPNTRHFVDVERDPDTIKKLFAKRVAKKIPANKEKDAPSDVDQKAPGKEPAETVAPQESIESGAIPFDTVDSSKPIPFPDLSPAPEEKQEEKQRGKGIVLALAIAAGASLLLGALFWNMAKEG